jgi:hypothetical protein
MEITDTPSYRYPGTKPFETGDSSLFKGRDEDIQNLEQKLFLQNLIVLYSRSGLGKSSLLNAGLLGHLQQKGNIIPLVIRFGAFMPGSPATPLEKIQGIISNKFPGNATSFLYDKLLKDGTATAQRLWYLFKEIQLQQQGDKTFVIIFDQFEELFGYPEPTVQAFGKELSELLFVSVPQQLRNMITAKLETEEDILTDEEIEQLYHPLTVKILFAIRSDKLSLLHNLEAYFPSVLQNSYELKPLSRRQATEAIVVPAGLTGRSFLSPPFTYAQEAINLILDALTKSAGSSIGQNSQDIETFQLQIVCKHTETLVIDKKLTQITPADLGNIKDIFENLYRNVIDGLAAENRLPARQLLEEKLIIDGVRVSMPVAFILKENGMTRDLLNELIASHIIRPEQNDTVEISHDTLIEPIQRFYEERKKEEYVQNELKEKESEIQRIKTEQQKQLEETAAKLKSRRSKSIQVMITVVLVIFTAVAFFMWLQSREAVKKARAYMLSIQAQNHVNENPTTAFNLAYQAVQLFPDTFIVNRAFEIMMGNRFYKNIVHVQPKSFLSISKYGDRIISSSPDGKDTVWNINGKVMNTFTQTSQLRAVDFSKDGQVILTGSVNGDVTLRKSTGDIITSISNEGAAITTALFSPDERSFFIRSEKDRGVARIISKDKNLSVSFNADGIVCGIFSPDGTRVLTGSGDGTIQLWSLAAKQTGNAKTWSGAIMSSEFIDDNNFLVGSWDGILSLWNVNTVTRPDARYSAVFNNNDAVSAIAVAWTNDKDSFQIYTGNYKGILRSTENIKNTLSFPNDLVINESEELKGHKGAIHNMVYNQSNKTLYSCSADFTVKKWTPDIPVNKDSLSNTAKIDLMEKFMKTNEVEPLTADQQKRFNIN